MFNLFLMKNNNFPNIKNLEEWRDFIHLQTPLTPDGGRLDSHIRVCSV